MRVLLDANIILDCLVTEKSGQPRPGKSASESVINLCDQQLHQGLVAWHTLPIISYYYRRQHSESDTAAMMNALLSFLEVPTVGHADVANWQSLGASDFEDALQIASAVSGRADFVITRNFADFAGAPIPALTPEEFLLNREDPDYA